VSLVLDAGALLAIERGDRDAVALIKRELLSQRVPVTHGAVVGQVWRGGSGRQANLARLLRALDIAAVDASLGRRAGVLLGRAGTSDVVDAALVLLAVDGDSVLTSDPEDISRLAVLAGVDVEVVRV
jgi:hypothetical protein